VCFRFNVRLGGARIGFRKPSAGIAELDADSDQLNLGPNSDVDGDNVSDGSRAGSFGSCDLEGALELMLDEVVAGWEEDETAVLHRFSF
jgi:hypothetical protein